MKRFKTLICICLILIVVSSMAIVIGRYAISKNVTESSSEMQIAESKKNVQEINKEINYGDDNAINAEFNKENTLYGTLIIKKSSSSYGITRLDGYELKVGHLIIDGASGDITEGAFKDYEYLRTIYMHDGYINKIQKEAFYNNNALATVVIDESVEYIGSKAFAKCPNLKKVIIRGCNKELKIEDDAFDLDVDIILYCKKDTPAYKWVIKQMAKSKIYWGTDETVPEPSLTFSTKE